MLVVNFLYSELYSILVLAYLLIYQREWESNPPPLSTHLYGPFLLQTIPTVPNPTCKGSASFTTDDDDDDDNEGWVLLTLGSGVSLCSI